MGSFTAQRPSLDEALRKAIPLLRDSATPGALEASDLHALSPGERLVTWALDDWPLDDLERWQATIGLPQTAASSPLRAVSVRTATATALWRLITECGCRVRASVNRTR